MSTRSVEPSRVVLWARRTERELEGETEESFGQRRGELE